MRIRSLSPLIMAGLLASCATPSVTLLTSEEGRQGAVALLEENGKPVESEISELNSRTNLSGKPRTRSIDPAKLSARKRTLLSELPPPPMRQTLYFKEGTTELMPESEPGLAYLKAEVAQRPGAEVQVTGYTDTLGSSEDNDLLSQQLTGALIEDRTATEREHTARLTQSVRHRFSLELAEELLAVLDEDVGDGCAGRGLDVAIGVVEADAKTRSEQFAHGRLPRARRADEHNSRWHQRTTSVSR